MNHSRFMRALLLAGIPLAGCTPDWYQRGADRDVARIVEQRKQQTLGYQPQSTAEVTAPARPTKRAYSKIPQTAVVTQAIQTLEPLSSEYPPQPLGPKQPLPEDDNFDFVPESYATYSASVERMGPPAPGAVHASLDLLKSIEFAVGNARDYQDQMEELYLAALDVTVSRHLFDPRPFADTTLGYSGDQGGLNRHPAGGREYRSALSAVNRFGVRQRLPYGGEVAARQTVTFVDTLSDQAADADSAETVLSASIPLLKGAGMVNLEPLIDSERQLVYAIRGFETYRRSFVVNIASRFFSLVSQQQQINNRRQNYLNLKLLSERSLAMFNAGSRVSFLDVQRARQNLLNAENSLIDSINGYQAALDTFKIIIGMPVEADLEIVPVELEVNIPDLENSDAAALAVKYRLNLQTARDRIDDARRNVSNTKNGLLPAVDLFADTGVGNLDGDPVTEYNADSWGYSGGVRIDFPLDRVSERSSYRRALIQLERARRSYVQTREQVVSDVRQIARQIRLAMITLEIQKRSVELNQRRLDLANERLTQGKAQVLDVVDAQSALLNAQDAYDRARANLQTQVLQYLRDTGTLRIDPSAGSIGRALDRMDVLERNQDMFDDIDRKLKDLENQ